MPPESTPGGGYKGAVMLGGSEARFGSPAAGIGMVHQEFMLIPHEGARCSARSG